MPTLLKLWLQISFRIFIGGVAFGISLALHIRVKIIVGHICSKKYIIGYNIDFSPHMHMPQHKFAHTRHIYPLELVLASPLGAKPRPFGYFLCGHAATTRQQLTTSTSHYSILLPLILNMCRSFVFFSITLIIHFIFKNYELSVYMLKRQLQYIW